MSRYRRKTFRSRVIHEEFIPNPYRQRTDVGTRILHLECGHSHLRSASNRVSATMRCVLCEKANKPRAATRLYSIMRESASGDGV